MPKKCGRRFGQMLFLAVTRRKVKNKDFDFREKVVSWSCHIVPNKKGFWRCQENVTIYNYFVLGINTRDLLADNFDVISVIGCSYIYFVPFAFQVAKLLNIRYKNGQERWRLPLLRKWFYSYLIVFSLNHSFCSFGHVTMMGPFLAVFSLWSLSTCKFLQLRLVKTNPHWSSFVKFPCFRF